MVLFVVLSLEYVENILQNSKHTHTQNLPNSWIFIKVQKLRSLVLNQIKSIRFVCKVLKIQDKYLIRSDIFHTCIHTYLNLNENLRNA